MVEVSTASRPTTPDGVWSGAGGGGEPAFADWFRCDGDVRAATTPPRSGVDATGAVPLVRVPAPGPPQPAADDPPTEPLPVVAAASTAVWIDPADVAAAQRPSPPPVLRRPLGRPLARAAVLAVLIALVGSGATALAMDKTVTVTVDGQDRVLHTYAADVAGALQAAGLAPVARDRVEPAMPTDVADGDHIIVDRARRLTLVDGGVERSVWTTAGSVQEALSRLGMDAAPAQLSAPPTAAIPLTGMSLELRVPRTVSLTDGTGTPQQLTTMASTVAGLLAERGIELGPDDVSDPPGAAALNAGDSVQVVRNGVGEVVEVRPVPAPEKVIEDPDMPRGKRVVVAKGKAGERTAIMRVLVRNGREVRREQVRAGGSTAPQPRVIKLGTGADADTDDEPDSSEEGSGPAPKVSDAGTWEKLARCEATGDWSINSGNGYYGGLQFDAGTWRAYGGTAFAPLPHQASPKEQMAVASKVRDDRGGYGAWPACSRKLGLPR